MENCFFITKSSRQTILLGREIALKLKPFDVVVLEGNLGSGKTTFTKGLALGLGIKDEIESPSFNIVKEYNGRIPLYHIDLYRLSSIDYLFLEDYFNAGGILVIEWPDLLRHLLPKETIFLNFCFLEKAKVSCRKIFLNYEGKRGFCDSLLKNEDSCY